MKMPSCAFLLVAVTAQSGAANMEDILQYDMQGVSLAHPIDTIENTVTARGFATIARPKQQPGNWKFEKKQNGTSEIYEVRIGRDGAVQSIRYQKSAAPDDEQSIDMQAEYSVLSNMASGETDNCQAYPSGGFQCVLHAGHGMTRASLSARTGRGTVYFSVSR